MKWFWENAKDTAILGFFFAGLSFIVLTLTLAALAGAGFLQSLIDGIH